MAKGIAAGASAVAKSPIGFARGLTYALRGMRFVYLQHPTLARYWIFPIAITTVSIVLVFYGAGAFYEDVGGALWSLFPEGWNDTTGWIGGLVRAFRWLVELVAGILLTLFGLVLVVLGSSIVAAPFNDALSEAVESILTGEAAPAFSLSRTVADLFRTVRLEVGKVLFYALVVGPLFIVSVFLPGIGQLVSIVAFGLTAIYLGVDYIDWPAARRDWSVGDRIAFTKRQLAAVAGFGTGVWLLLFIPLVNLFFMPAAVAGGTLLFVETLGPDRRNPLVSRG